MFSKKNKNEKKSFKKSAPAEDFEILRVKTPKGNQTIGVVETRLGGSRMRVKCFDAKTRICRIPGRLKQRLWVREGNYVLVEPWELGGNDKADIIYKYRPNQVAWLKKKGYIKEIITDLEEF